MQEVSGRCVEALWSLRETGLCASEACQCGSLEWCLMFGHCKGLFSNVVGDGQQGYATIGTTSFFPYALS